MGSPYCLYKNSRLEPILSMPSELGRISKSRRSKQGHSLHPFAKFQVAELKY